MKNVILILPPYPYYAPFPILLFTFSLHCTYIPEEKNMQFDYLYLTVQIQSDGYCLFISSCAKERPFADSGALKSAHICRPPYPCRTYL